MSLYRFFRISKPSETKVEEGRVDSVYKKMRNSTFWAATVAYSLYYICRMAISVVKQPIIDSGFLSPRQLGIMGSAFLFVYAFGKFMNGFIADYCNIRRFMAAGILISAVINVVLGGLGLLGTTLGLSTTIMFVLFVILWGLNGWVQSMGAPPAIISLSRWYPLSKRGTYYSIVSATPYLGKFLSFISIGALVGWFGWQHGFTFAALGGFLGGAVILLFMHDTPESCGLPSVQKLSKEKTLKSDTMPTKILQGNVVKHPGIWIIAITSGFLYITQYAVSGWGVFFLQKEKSFSLNDATQIIAFSEIFGVAGTLAAGWLSDVIFKGSRVKPVILSGIISFVSLGLFLFVGDTYFINLLYASIFSLAMGILFCIAAGLMALDIVPRKATGAAMGIIGIFSYIAAGIQDVVSGYLIEGCSTVTAELTHYNFVPVAVFWLSACLISFILPIFASRFTHGVEDVE